MRISHNIPAMQSLGSVGRANKKAQNSIVRISSGVKINSSKDDRAGLAIANKITNEINGLNMANRNSLDGISLIQTADGSLSEINNILQRIRELAVQSSNETLIAEDREKIQYEVNSLIDEIDALSYKTEFNGIKLLYGEISRTGISSNDEIAKIDTISDNSLTGFLNYDIEKMGVPAKITTTNISSGVSGNLKLNGEIIKISDSDTKEQIINKIRSAGNRTGIYVLEDGDKVHLITKEIGSSEEIKISMDNNELSNSLGLTEGAVKGIDAKVSNVRFTDKNGNINTWYTNSISTVVKGNEIQIISDSGKTSLKLNMLIKSDGTFSLLDGTSVSDAGVMSSKIPMSAEIKGHGALVLHIGPNKNMNMTVNIPKTTTETLGVLGINLQSTEDSVKSITEIDEALAKISIIKANLGAYQNRLEFANKTLDTSSLNSSEALSRIIDTDIAKEMTEYTKENIISQAGLSILAQANQRPQLILQLLQ